MTTNQESAALDEITDPPKLLRLGSMVKQLLDEIHTMSLDERCRARLTTVYDHAAAELTAALPDALRTEFADIAPAIHTGAVVSDAELRIAQAQLVGWLEGLFQGVQFAGMVEQARPEKRGVDSHQR